MEKKNEMTMVRPGVYEEATGSNLTFREVYVGEIIADRRKQLKMSQQELADKVGVNRSTISRYESGTYKKISYKMLDQIAQVLDMTDDYLWARTDDPHESLQNEYDDETERAIALFRRLSPDQKAAVETIMKSMVQEE